MSSGETEQNRGPIGRPAPQYGEYAPEGWSQPKPVSTPAPAPAAPASAPAPAGARGPVPGPGQGGSRGYIPYPGAYPQPASPAVRRRNADRIATIVLLVVGAAGALIGVRTALSLTDSMTVLYAQAGLPAYEPDPRIAIVTPVIWISHAALYLGALIGSILLLRAGRPAFWLPLAAGIAAAIVFWVGIGLVVGNDPNLMQIYSTVGLG